MGREGGLDLHVGVWVGVRVKVGARAMIKGYSCVRRGFVSWGFRVRVSELGF